MLTVGDPSPSSAVGPTADRRVKPDVILADSRAFFTDGEASAGSSNAAAYVAGVVAVLKAVEPGLRPRHLLRLAEQGSTAADPKPPSAIGDGVARIGRDGRITLVSPASPSRPASSARLGLRNWRTPGRARLAEIVREGR